jgi:hypothetical protein
VRPLLLLLCLTQTALAADLDGDGYDESVDCDDANADVHPQQPESCEIGEQIDNDCNGDINSAEGYIELEDWIEGTHFELYIDEDLDGFGTDEIDGVQACEMVDGYSTNATDCDDTNSIIYPGADELCDDKDNDCDKSIDEPELNEDSGCVAMFKDQDEDGYGDFDKEVCLCPSGSDKFSVNPNDGFTYVTFGGDCNDNYSTLKPLSCADGYDNDADGLSDADDPDCAAGFDETGDELESPRELLDGHDNDCDGQIPAVELDCDDDGSLPLLPLEYTAIDGADHPDYTDYDDYREAWTDEGFQTADDLGLGACAVGAVQELAECFGEAVELACTDGLWMLAYTESADGHGDRYDGGLRSYPDGTLTSIGGDCDDHCDLRYPGGEEVCDGVDNTCSDVDPGTDDDGIPDALDASVSLGGSIPLAESDADGDGALDCDSFSAGDSDGWSEGGCTAVEDAEWLSDADDSDPDIISEDDSDDASELDDDKAASSCATGPGVGGLAVLFSMLLGVRRRSGRL